MKVEELRIGNWLLLNNKPKKVLWFKYSKVCVMNEYPSAIVDLERIKPIELTEEILLSIKGINKKIVYNKGLELTIYTINNIELLFTFGILRNIKFMNNKVIIYTDFRDFKLHDLQNLYFVLNGKELEINL